MSKKQKVKYVWGKDVDLDKTVILDKQGNRLTNARAEKIAQEIIKQATGRPSLTGPPTHQEHHNDNYEHYVKLVEPAGCLRETMPAPMWDNLVWLHAPTTLRPQFLAPSFASPSPSATQ